MKLNVPTIPAASVAFGFLAVKTFVPVLPAPPLVPLGLLAPPLASVHAGTNEVELGARLLTKFFIYFMFSWFYFVNVFIF